MSHEVVTIEDQLRKMRAGNKQVLSIKMGELEIPCRLLTATEEALIVASARLAVKAPTEQHRALMESIEIQKKVLEAACLVDGTPRCSRAFLDRLSSAELQHLFDQYMTIANKVNPEFESLSYDQIAEMIRAVKKKERTASDLFTWQLAEIGKYFLDVILPGVSEAGS